MIVFFAWALRWVLERRDQREFERDGGWQPVEYYYYQRDDSTRSKNGK